MSMKLWFSSKELTTIDGLPSTTQGINRKARVEKWQSRKREGVQGRGIEYHIDSLPIFVRDRLRAMEVRPPYNVDIAQPIQLWLTAYEELTNEEKKLVLSWLLRNGIDSLLEFINRKG